MTQRSYIDRGFDKYIEKPLVKIPETEEISSLDFESMVESIPASMIVPPVQLQSNS
jgi:hypothetical protein